MKLTFDDLLIGDSDLDELPACLGPWGFPLQGDVAPIFLNRFGSWFLRRRDDSVQMLDVLDGTVLEVAPSFDDFTALVNSAEWQERYLLSKQVFALHQAGVIAAGSQCYSLPHPAHGFPDPRIEGGSICNTRSS